jgi:predicted sulfurtransferase
MLKKKIQVVFHCMSGRRSNEAAIIAQKLGFGDCYNLEGGVKEWTGPIQPFMNNHSPWVHSIFETETETAQYVVTDLGNTYVIVSYFPD